MSAPAQGRRPCALCGKPQTEADKPFCSRRCADIDLSRWLSGVYAIPAQPDPDEDPDGGALGPEAGPDAWPGR